MLLNEFEADSAVLIDAASRQPTTAASIRTRARELRELTPPGGVAFLYVAPGIDSARDLHALVEARIPVALFDARDDDGNKTRLVDAYQPTTVLGANGHMPGYEAKGPGLWTRRRRPRHRAHPDLAVMLTTSGSTGSPKLVRLSRGNVAANARQITISLGIRASDRGVTLLPLHYSFGMSILTSHALAGSAVVTTTGSVLDSTLWAQVRELGVTYLPGVPQTYQMLRRLKFFQRDLPELRALIQAGGRLDPELVEEFSEAMRQRGGNFFVMYGQTEAAPRIACLPPERLPEKIGSAGCAVPEGRLEIVNADGQVMPPGEVGQVRYTGPNVMMGYAENHADLELGDTQGDSLDTGDIGRLDEDGFLFLTGRSKRIAKIAGLRISLDDVEQRMAAGSVAIESPVGTITLFTPSGTTPTITVDARNLAKQLRIPPRSIRALQTEQLPLLANGKPDYRRLESMAREV